MHSANERVVNPLYIVNWGEHKLFPFELFDSTQFVHGLFVLSLFILGLFVLDLFVLGLFILSLFVLGLFGQDINQFVHFIFSNCSILGSKLDCLSALIFSSVLPSRWFNSNRFDA